MTILEQIHLHTQRLPPDMQREVLDFIEFLETRQSQSSTPVSHTEAPGSCLELAQNYGLVGCLQEAPADLSTNSRHLQDYGA